MNKILNIKFTIILTFVALIFGGCKSLRVLPNKGPLKNIKTKELTKVLNSSAPKLTLLRSRLKVTFDDGNRSQQLVVNLRMEKDKMIWLSATMLIPIAKMIITPKTISFYEKFQKNYYEGDLSFINEYLGIDFEYENLQNVLIGKPVIELRKGKWEQIKNPKFYVISPKSYNNDFRPIFFFDPSTFLLKEQRLIFNDTNKSLMIFYDDFQKVDGKLVPSKISLNLIGKNDIIKIILEFTRAEIPNNLTFPFSTPSGYSPIKFK